MIKQISNRVSKIARPSANSQVFFFLWLFLLVCSPESLFSQTNLQTPQLDSISITPDGKPIIAWFPNTDNTLGYVIVQQQGVVWQRVDTIIGINQTSYTHLDADPCTKTEWYRIYAFNPGNIPNNSPWSDTLITILLNQPQHNICANTISLNWTDYINMREELAGYEVLASIDGVNFQVLATTSPTVTSYVHINPLPDEEYSYQIRAVNEDGTRTSSSCVKTILSRTYPKPDFVNIISASVEDNSYISVQWDADPDAPILKFEVERRAPDESMFSVQQTLQDDVNYTPGKSYSDMTADFGSSSYEYRIVMRDSCGVTYTNSAIHQTVHLSGQPFPDYTNRLEWNRYEGWDVDKYNIYRSTDGTFSIIDDLDGNATSFTDDVSAFSGTGGVFQYYVEAVENHSTNVVSKSNHITLEMETRVIVPNAFIPDGMPPDNEFKPIVSFIADGSYEMLIFNKWGQLIFTATDPNEGWTGKQNGELHPPGAYVYLIKYRTPEGQNMEKRGTVTILR